MSRTLKQNKRGGNIMDIPYGMIDGDADNLLKQMDCKSRANWCISNPDYCKSSVIYDTYLKPCKIMAEALKTKDILNDLDCKSRVNWCSANKARRRHCSKPIIQKMYISPCKQIAKQNRYIRRISTTDIQEFLDIPLYSIILNENISLIEYVNDILWWGSKRFPINDDFPWEFVQNQVNYALDYSLGRIGLNIYTSSLLDMFDVLNRPNGEDILYQSLKHFRDMFNDNVLRMYRMGMRHADQMNLSIINIIIMRVLNAFAIGNPITIEYSTYKIDQIQETIINVPDYDTDEESDYDY
tara:strand:+ start:572 stop:1462 length:891 start_codon:yes stop_codon:yes gene_type:complete